MRMILDVTFPMEPFNTLVRQKKAGQLLSRILDELKPEAAYFSEHNGKRGAILIIDLPGPSAIPAASEPFFLQLNAECRFRIVMTPDDLRQAGLDGLGTKWK